MTTAEESERLKRSVLLLQRVTREIREACAECRRLDMGAVRAIETPEGRLGDELKIDTLTFYSVTGLPSCRLVEIESPDAGIKRLTAIVEIELLEQMFGVWCDTMTESFRRHGIEVSL